MILTVLRCLQEALVGDLCSFHLDGRQVPYIPFRFIVEGIFLADHRVAFGWNIGRSQATFAAIGSIYLEFLIQLPVRQRITPAAQGIVVYEDSVVAAADDERHGNLGIVLVEFLVPALVVELEGLLLPKAIESLPFRGIEDQSGGISFLPLDTDRSE